MAEKLTDASAGQLLDRSTATPAGRFFLPPPSRATQLPPAPAAFFVVHVSIGLGGFSVAGRTVPPRGFAAALRLCPEWRNRPVMVITVGDQVSRQHAGSLLLALANALDVSVYGGDAAVYLGAGILITSGSFLRWSPSSRRPAGGQPVAVGRLLPATPVPSRRAAVSGQPSLSAEPAITVVAGSAPIAPVPAPDSVATQPAVPSPQSLVLQPLDVEPLSLEPVKLEPVKLEPVKLTPVVLQPLSLPGEMITSIHVPALALPSRNPPETATTSALSTLSTLSAPSTQTASSGKEAASDGGVPEVVIAPAPDLAVVAAQPRRDTVRPATRPWLRVASAASAEDWKQLRSVIGARYDDHAQAVAGMLAMRPGLRVSVGEDRIAGLVALRAYLFDADLAVDFLLRGEPQELPQSLGANEVKLAEARAALLARCVVSGLRRLPSVVGPVYRPGTVDPQILDRYRTGARLVEPAFTEARLTPSPRSGETVQYAIWSSTGKKAEWVSGAPRVLFSAGSHFLVLAVDDAAAGQPVQVLLREVPAFASSDAKLDERARQRLRLAEQPKVVSQEPDPVLEEPKAWRFPLGVRGDAVPFAVDGYQDDADTLAVQV